MARQNLQTVISWRVLLIVSILLVIFGVAFGDYLIYHNEQKIVLAPHSTLIVSNAAIIAQKPQALAPTGFKEIGQIQSSNVYTVSSATLTNTYSTNYTLILIHDSSLFKIDFILVGMGILLLIISLLGIVYTKVVKRG